MANTEKNINSRVQLKHDTETNWLKAVNFIPKAGELIIYDPDSYCDFTRLKFGDGVTKVNNLPFLFEKLAEIEKQLATYQAFLVKKSTEEGGN